VGPRSDLNALSRRRIRSPCRQSSLVAILTELSRLLVHTSMFKYSPPYCVRILTQRVLMARNESVKSMTYDLLGLSLSDLAAKYF
jgi:hypothetical protein